MTVIPDTCFKDGCLLIYNKKINAMVCTQCGTIYDIRTDEVVIGDACMQYYYLHERYKEPQHG